MSAVQRFPRKIQRAFEELLEIQQIRSKLKMERKIQIGNGIAKFLDDADKIIQQNAGNIVIENIEGNVYLSMEYYSHRESIRLLSIPCHEILYYSCINTAITFYLTEELFARKCIFELNTIEQVNMILSKVKPRVNPRPNTYQHDGNVTSSDTDSNDSSRGKTGGVNNSFESDNSDNSIYK